MGNKESRELSTEEQEKAAMEEFGKWLNKRLTQYFEDMDTMVLDVKIKRDTKREIAEAVEEMMGNIFKEVEEIDKRFRVRKTGLLKVGDFYENTEIVCCDEIEIYAVLENLSGDDLIQTENATTEHFETIQVRVKEKSAQQWTDCLADDSDKMYILNGQRLTTRMFDVVNIAIENVRSKPRDVVYKKHGYLELLENLVLSQQSCSICLKLGWTGSRFLSLTMTPVLKLTRPDSYILRQECLNDLVFKAVVESGSVLLVPEKETEGKCYFRLSLAHSDTFIINNCVSESHKRVYRVLQFLVNGFNKKETSQTQLFKQQEVKHFLIMHDMTCSKTDAIGGCTLAILDKMEETLTEPNKNDGSLFIPSIYAEHMNILRRSAASSSQEIRNQNLSAVSRVKSHLVNDVGRSPSYVYSDVINKLVPVNQSILHADYHARKSMVDVRDGVRDDISAKTSGLEI